MKGHRKISAKKPSKHKDKVINEEEAREQPVGRGRERCDLCNERTRTETAEFERTEIAECDR